MSGTQTDVYSQKMSPFIDDLTLFITMITLFLLRSARIQSTQVISLLNLQAGRGNHSVNIVKI